MVKRKVKKVVRKVKKKTKAQIKTARIKNLAKARRAKKAKAKK